MNPTVSSPQNISAVGVAGLGAPGPDAASPGAAASEPAAKPPPGCTCPARSRSQHRAVYVLLAIAVVFTVWAPSTFPTWTTARQILDGTRPPG